MYEYIGHTDRQLNRYVRLLTLRTTYRHSVSSYQPVHTSTSTDTSLQANVVKRTIPTYWIQPAPSLRTSTSTYQPANRHTTPRVRVYQVRIRTASKHKCNSEGNRIPPCPHFPIFRRLDIGIHASNKCKLARPRQDDVECARPRRCYTCSTDRQLLRIHVPGTCVVGMLSSIVPTVRPWESPLLPAHARDQRRWRSMQTGTLVYCSLYVHNR